MPRNDELFDVDFGDIILYQGNFRVIIYYDKNKWSLTKLGKVDNISKSGLKGILGSGDVEGTISK